MNTDRREFLKLLSTAAASATLPASIARALAIPASSGTGSINDVEHVVFLMQENRSFDHYFGTLRGVRGFGDRRDQHVLAPAGGTRGAGFPPPPPSGRAGGGGAPPPPPPPWGAAPSGAGGPRGGRGAPPPPAP